MISQEYTAKRDAYMRHEITYHEFYTWVAEQAGIGWGDSDTFLGLTLNEWTDKYNADQWLNNVPLALFDRMMPYYEAGARRAGLWVALADCTCTYKSVIIDKILEASNGATK